MFLLGAQACSLSARKSVPCWRIIVSSVGTHKCSLLAYKRVHCRRTKLFLAHMRMHCRRTQLFLVGTQACSRVFTVGASSCPLSAHTCWRTRASTVAAQKCSSLARKCVPCRPASVFPVVAPRNRPRIHRDARLHSSFCLRVRAKRKTIQTKLSVRLQATS